MNVEPVRVMSMIKNKTWANHLYTHEKNKRIVNTSGAYYYLDVTNKYRILSGLRPRLERIYWPNSSYYQMMKQQREQKGPPPRSKKIKGQHSKPRKVEENKGRFGGLIRGVHVHTQLKDFVVLDQKNFKKKHEELHPYCTKIMQAIIGRLNLKVFISELDVYDENIGIATSIDMIGLDQDGKLGILEFKTGYKTSFDCHDGNMQFSLSNMRNTLQNQSIVQVLTGAIILHRAFGIPLDQMKLHVLRVDDETLDIIPVPDEFLEKMATPIYNDLLNFNTNK